MENDFQVILNSYHRLLPSTICVEEKDAKADAETPETSVAASSGGEAAAAEAPDGTQPVCKPQPKRVCMATCKCQGDTIESKAKVATCKNLIRIVQAVEKARSVIAAASEAKQVVLETHGRRVFSRSMSRV